jgi:hypothetical protein
MKFVQVAHHPRRRFLDTVLYSTLKFLQEAVITSGCKEVQVKGHSRQFILSVAFDRISS